MDPARVSAGAAVAGVVVTLVGAILIPSCIHDASIEISDAQFKAQQAAETQRQAALLEAEDERAKDALLRAYLDRISGLMLNEDLHRSNEKNTEENNALRDVARARTMVTLIEVGSDRKRAVVRALYETNLIKTQDPTNITRDGYDNLCVDDTVVCLSGANLDGADLSESDLSQVDFEGARLIAANLSDINLEGADLRGARFESANLSGANLSGANLEGAVVSKAQLAEAESIKGATMPDGSKRP